MKHMDLKQMELDTAAAKVDELTKQLESLWSDSPAPPGTQTGVPSRVSLVTPTDPTLPSQLLSMPQGRLECVRWYRLWGTQDRPEDRYS